MRHLQLTCELFDRAITAEILCLEQGLHVSVYGGDFPHIGAVSIVDLNGVCKTEEFPEHRDSAISSRWARQLADAGFLPVVVEAGIHYDRLSEAGIQSVLTKTDALLCEIQAELLKTAQEHTIME